MEGGPPTFRQDFTCPALLEDQCAFYPYGALTLYGPTFQYGSGSYALATGLVRVRSPLLAESLLMSFPPATEMFQFAGFASRAYVFSAGYPKGVGFPIRKSPDQSLLAAPRGLSQRATSFIASRCQGIHQMPFSRLRITSMRRDKPKPHGRSFNSRSKHDLQGSSKSRRNRRRSHTYSR